MLFIINCMKKSSQDCQGSVTSYLLSTYISKYTHSVLIKSSTQFFFFCNIYWFCTSHCFALFIPLHILFLFLFFYHIYALVLCYFISFFILLHCPLSGPDLMYISLLIIPCIIYYVTIKKPWPDLDFGLVLFMVLWQSPDTPVMSGFHVSARLRVCSRVCALSSACLVHVGAWCFGSWHSCLEFRLRVGVRTLALHVLSLCVSVRSRVRSAARSSVHVLACFHVVMSVWIRGWWVFSNSCVFMSCFAHGWWFSLAMWLCFCFVWAHGFCLSFCVPCALMSICLDPTHLVICPTCLPSLPSSFAPFIISLCLHFRCCFVVSHRMSCVLS